MRISVIRAIRREIQRRNAYALFAFRSTHGDWIGQVGCRLADWNGPIRIIAQSDGHATEAHAMAQAVITRDWYARNESRDIPIEMPK